MIIYSFKTINQKEKPGFFVYFVAKKKVFKKAVLRNKAKRIARHAFLDAKKEMLKNNKDLIYKDKQVIFFLENGIIQESYTNIVKNFIKDILIINNK